MSHRYVFLVPREWLEGPWAQLEIMIYDKILNYYRRFRKMGGVAFHYGGILAFLQYNDKLIWFRKYDDQRSRPDLKEYLAFSIPCIHCTEK
uniref:BV6 family protein n=1 Tax=Microplitis mediator bracovirus TaxID=1836595 RepID=A0A1C8XNC8_9VIRU|nr:hypothetical protein A6F54_42 [Microplitis mediator bracovirus]